MHYRPTNDRRSFIKAGLAGMAGVAAFPGARLNAAGKELSRGTLVVRTLGKTGLKVPIVSMGTGDVKDLALIRAAMDSGIVLLATSQYYGDGNNERLVGEAIKGRKRDSLIIVTSVMPDGIDHKAGLFTDESKTEPFIGKFEGSLQRLGVSEVDIFLLPFAAKRESVFYEPLLKAMEKIKRQGKARFIGIATHQFSDEAVRAAVEAKIYDVAMVGYNVRRQNQEGIGEAIAFAAGKGLGIIGMKTMAGAFWDKERKQPINTRAALKWVLQNENVHTTVPGITSFDQLTQDISLMADLTLSDEEKTDLKLSRHETPDGPNCQQCSECIGQCAYGLDIPTLMRSHMYAYGYRNLSRARATLELADISGSPCGRCKSCSVVCPMSYDVRSKVTDIARLREVPRGFVA
jgi:predicted aldo/keto reductase-like oxidoreductase